MSAHERNTQWAMLVVVGALVLSGATRPREVAAHAQGPRRPAQSAPASSASQGAPDSAAVSADPGVTPKALLGIAAGDYLPFYKGKSGARARPVPAFNVAAQPVARGDFLRFVRADPRWRRSHVARVFAEASYLADWNSDLDPGASSPLSSPVTGVSWFAAKAYCASVGLRLPTTVEWERALSVVGQSFLATAGVRADSNLAASLWEWTADFNSVPLADGDSTDSVATLFCGAGARATDATDYGAFLRYSFRSSLKGDFALKNLGFRCAQGPP